MVVDVKAEQGPLHEGGNYSGTNESFIRYARRMLTTRFRGAGLSQSEAEDLTQECLIDLITRLDRFDAERGTIDVWIGGFARNALRAWWRKEASRRLTEISIKQLPESGLAVDEAELEISAMKYGLGELSLIDQELLYMRFAMGMSFEEIAGSTDLSCVNARKRVSRAVERLRRDPAIREALGF